MKVAILILLVFQLENIAYSGTYAEAAVYAKNILCFVTGDCEDVLFIPDPVTSGKVAPIANPMLELTKSETSIEVYPNPATTYVTFEYDMPEFVKEAILLITDVNGKIIKNLKLNQSKGQELWDTRKVKNGIYLYVLKNDKGETLTSGKVSIIK